MKLSRFLLARVGTLTCALLAGCARESARDRDLMARGMLGQRPWVANGLAGDQLFVRALRAETTLARMNFVPGNVRRFAAFDLPLKIGWKQTISDPYIVAVMTAAARVRDGSNVLEVGTGSGYQAAVLSRVGAKVSTIEIVPQLSRRATSTLRRLGMTDVATRAGDGYAGWPERAPFDAIIVTAGAAAIPKPLVDQLSPGGTLVMPIGPSTFQEQIEVVRKDRGGRLDRCTLGAAAFVPFTGRGQTPAEVRGLMDSSLPYCYGEPVT